MKVGELIDMLSGLNVDAEVYVLGYEKDDESYISTEMRSILYDGEIVEIRGPVVKE